MMAALILMGAQTAPTPPVAPVTRPAEVAPLPPANWLTLPELHFRRRPDLAADLSGYVRDEVRAGHCTAGRAADGTEQLEVDLAVLVPSAGTVRRIVPRAIGCPTVEQYARGLVERMARDNLDPQGDPGGSWFHTAITFTWRD